MSTKEDGHHECDFDEDAQTCPWAERAKAEYAKRGSVWLPDGWTRTLEPHCDCAPAIVYDSDRLRSGYHNSHHDFRHIYVDAAYDEETDISPTQLVLLRAAMKADSAWLIDFIKREGR